MNSNNIWKILLLSIFISDLDLHLHALVEADDSVRTLEIISLISILGLYQIIQKTILFEISFSFSAAWAAGKRSKELIFAMASAAMDIMKSLKLPHF